MKIAAFAIATIIGLSLATPGASANASPCPQALEDPRGFIFCYITLKDPMPITTLASATVHQTFNDGGVCVVVDATAQVKARGAIMSYDWAVAWTVTLSDGTVIEGPSKANEHDTRAVIQERVVVTGLRLDPGDSISAGAAIGNNDLVFDGDSAAQGWTCNLNGDLVEDALRNLQNL